jgi:MFS family permease
MRYVRSRPDIMLMMAVVFSAGTFGLNFQMTTALMATDVYGKGAGEYGILGSVLAVGSLAGSLLAARRKVVRQRLVIVGAVAFGTVEMIAGLMPTYLTYVLILPLCGFAALTMITAANTFVQLSVDPQMRGRVVALYMAIFMGGTPVGAPALGWISEQYGARWTMLVGGLLTVVGTLIAAAVFARSEDLTLTTRLHSRPHIDVVARQPDPVTDTIVAV